MHSRPIAVLGAGSWGTALAVQLARAGDGAALWSRDEAVQRELAATRRNRRYLPDVVLPGNLAIGHELRAVVAGQPDLLVCVPSQAFRPLLQAVAPCLGPGARVAWATKGFERATGLLPHQVAREVLGPEVPLAVLSGPTFAREVGQGLPTAMSIASGDLVFARDLAERISDRNFRAYTSTDMVGVEVGGAVKNVLAIGAGISDGLGFGANTRIALITRGLMEMTRLGTALGARPTTFMGLSGMGDLVLTCTDNQSRNRRLGLLLAGGATVTAALDQIGQAVEGVHGATAVTAVARRLGLEVPICTEVFRILHEGAPPGDAVRALMARSLKPESELEW